MAEEEAINQEQEQDGKKKGKGKLIIIIAIVLIIVLGITGALLFGGSSSETGDGAPTIAEVVYERIDFGEYIVNLSASNTYLKIQLIVEYDPTLVLGGGHGEGGGHGFGGGLSGGGEEAAATGLPGVFGEREPVIKDAIIRILSAKSKDELLTTEGKELLKEELVEAINEACELDEDPVVNVYFGQFLIQ